MYGRSLKIVRFRFICYTCIWDLGIFFRPYTVGQVPGTCTNRMVTCLYINMYTWVPTYNVNVKHTVGTCTSSVVRSSSTRSTVLHVVRTYTYYMYVSYRYTFIHVVHTCTTCTCTYTYYIHDMTYECVHIHTYM